MFFIYKVTLKRGKKMLLAFILMSIALFMVWISMLCYGMYRGYLSQGITIAFLDGVRYKLIPSSSIPFIVSLYSAAKSLSDLPQEIIAINIEVFILYLIIFIVFLYSTSFGSGYCIGYFSAKSGRF